MAFVSARGTLPEARVSGAPRWEGDSAGCLQGGGMAGIDPFLDHDGAPQRDLRRGETIETAVQPLRDARVQALAHVSGLGGLQLWVIRSVCRQQASEFVEAVLLLEEREVEAP